MENRPPVASLPSPAQVVTLWLAGVFFSLACFGFLPGVAQHTESLATWFPAPGQLLFGLFHVSVLHNAIHLLLGVTALLAVSTERRCRRYLATTGATLLLLVLYGLIRDDPLIPGLIPAESADAWLHVALAATMLIACFVRPERLTWRRR